MQSYAAARSLFTFLAGIAWCAIFGGAILGIVAAGVVNEFNRSLPAILGAALPGIIIALIGLLALAQVQMGRASVDSAEFSQQALQVARDQLAFAKQVHLEAGGYSAESATFFEPSPSKPVAAQPEPPSTAQAKPRDTAHKGFAITANVDGTYKALNKSFDTLDAAKAHIDNRPAWLR